MVPIEMSSMKGQVIFADPEHKEKAPQKPSTDPEVTLSRDEYREVMKEAYKEGLKAALTEKVKAEQTDDVALGKQEGLKAAKISAEKQHAEARQKLDNIADRHDIEILRAQSVFPIDPFPDTIIIDTTKITIVKKQMFATEHVITIPLKDLSDVHVQTALFLASITVKYMPHSNNPGMLEPVESRISTLKRADAMRVKNILKGILVAQSEEIDFTKLAPDEIMGMLEKFGNSEGVS
jgi:hypothetical protein